MSRILWNLGRRLGPGTISAPELAPFDAAARGRWAWEQPARFRPAWDLRVDGTAVATLALRGFLMRTAEVRTHAGRWTLRSKFPGDWLVVADGAETPCARFRPAWLRGGRIEREGRETLLWRSESFWAVRWGIFTPEKLPLLHLHFRRGALIVRRGGDVDLEDAARRLDDLPVLLALAWFLAMRTRHAHHSYP